MASGLMSRNAAVWAIVPAAGTGQRLGAGKPKAVCEISGITILERTLRTIRSIPGVRGVVVLVTSDQYEPLSMQHSTGRASIVIGGATRQESVWKGIQHLQKSNKVSKEDLILVHDAARCLVSEALLNNCILAAEKYNAVTAALPVPDTVKRTNEKGNLCETIAREKVVLIQTPQVFRFDLLVQAHTHAVSIGVSATDDASLVEPFNAVHVVRGELLNIKITTPEDLVLAEKILLT